MMAKTPKKPRVCLVPGCDTKQHAKGYCRVHYGRKWRHGSATAKKPKRKPTISEQKLAELASLEREWWRYKDLYDICVGTEARTRWSRKMSDAMGSIQAIAPGHEIRSKEELMPPQHRRKEPPPDDDEERDPAHDLFD
jgi:hypothetical protein